MKKHIMFFIIVSHFFCISIYAVDTYSISKLPADFHIKGMHCLNNYGQVAGYVGFTAWEKRPVGNSVSVHSERAAFWDANNDIKLFPLNDCYSKASSVNDFGYVAVESYSAQDPRCVAGGEKVSRVILWNVNSNELKYGPVGEPIAINNEGLVLIKRLKDGYHYFLWNSKDNTITTIETNSGNTLLGLTDGGNPYSGDPSPYDKYYSESRINSIENDIMWFYDGKNHYLSTCDGDQIVSRCSGSSCGRYLHPNTVRLNNKNDELVAITSSGAISKWRKNCKETKTLSMYANNLIFGFSNSGKILLGLSKDWSNLCLLTPLNK